MALGITAAGNFCGMRFMPRDNAQTLQFQGKEGEQWLAHGRYKPSVAPHERTTGDIRGGHGCLLPRLLLNRMRGPPYRSTYPPVRSVITGPNAQWKL